MFNLYFVKDIWGKRRLMSAKKIYSLVNDDSFNCDIDWQLNAKNLISLCNRKNFPEKYRYRIETNVMDFYSKLLYCDDSLLVDNKANLKAVCKLYNNLYGVDNIDVKNSRSDFLCSYLEYITNAYRKDFSDDLVNFNKAESAWRKEKFEKYVNSEYFDFDKKFDVLENSFCTWLTRLIKGGFLTKNTKEKKKKFSFKPGSTSVRTESNSKPKKYILR